MHIMRWSLLSAPAEPFSGYAMMPGVIFGLYASIIISGNPHGGETAPLLIVASIVNLRDSLIVAKVGIRAKANRCH